MHCAAGNLPGGLRERRPAAGAARRRAGAPLVLAALLAGCTTTIHPPPRPADPADVFIVDHGRTPSLVIPAADGGLRRYVYGDWRWYALRRTNPWTAVVAVLWPTQGALGRAVLSAGEPTPAYVRERFAGAEHVHRVTVERSRVRQLEQRMEAQYASRRATEVETASLGLRFVKHPAPYTYFHNSNHAVAGWLRELGCDIEGLALHSNWRVEPPRTREPRRRRTAWARP